MEKLPLFKRFVGSFIDKLIVLIVFGIAFLVIDSHASGKLMYYVLTLMKASPFAYQFAGVVDVSYVHFGFYMPSVEEYFQEFYSPNMYEGMVKAFDLKMTFSFILLNVVYYMVCEIWLKASLGKYAMGGILVDNFDDKITINDVFVRACTGAFLMSLFVGIRFLFNTNYYWVILFFFLFVDIPVLINNKSMIDKAGKVRYVKRANYEALHNTTEEVTN